MRNSGKCAHRLLLLLCAALLFPIVVFAQSPSQPKAGQDTERDFAVIETVLKDLLSRKDSPVEGKNDPNRKIRFNREVHEVRGNAVNLMKLQDKKYLEKLSAAQMKSVKEAADAVVNRKSDKEPFKEIKPSDPRIVVVEKKSAEVKRELWSPQSFWAAPPGFSKDGGVAFIKLSFTWSIHSGEGVYILEKREDGWIVLVCEFVYYL